MKARWIVVVGAFAAACSSSVPPATRAEIRNTCKKTADCAIYQQDLPLSCTRSQCVTSGTFLSVARLTSTTYPYTLAIAMPPTSSYQPGATVVVKSANLTLFVPADGSNLCNGDATTATCVQLARIGQYLGLYDVDPSAMKQAGRFVGNEDVTIPVHATYTLLTDDPTSTTTQHSMGIPVYSAYASLKSDLILHGQAKGPNGGAPIDFEADLPPGRYRRDIQVDPPFDDAFPPWTDFLTSDFAGPLPVKVGGGSSYISADFIAPLKPRFVGPDFKTPTGKFVCAGNDCTGWTASLVDEVTGRLRSNIHTFTSPTGGGFSLFNVIPPNALDIKDTDFTGQALLLAPPAGQALPSILSKEVVGGISGEQSYPAVQVAAVVHGTVSQQASADAGSNGAGVSAMVDFASNDVAFQLLYANAPLVYRTSVRTDAAGNYTAYLPRGTYDVAVTPDANGPPLAVTYGQVVVATTSSGGTDNYTQSGPAFDFVLHPPFAVVGHVTTVDGRALSGVAIAATRSLGASTPNIPAKLVDLARAAWTTTDANGDYTLPLDPGTYDVFAAPPVSSGFAWAVAPAAVVISPTGLLPGPLDLTIPVPFDASMRLYDPGGGFIQGALVQVFAALNPADPSSQQVQIGEGTTDSEGALVLYLPPKFPE